MYKGLGLCVLFTIGGFLLTALTGDRVSPLVFALVLGVIVGNLPMPWKSQSVEAGLKFSTRSHHFQKCREFCRLLPSPGLCLDPSQTST